MRKQREIKITKEAGKISYSALVTAIAEKIKNGGDVVFCENTENVKKLLEK